MILASSNKQVIPLDPDKPSHKEILKAIATAADMTTEELNRSHQTLKQSKRINEVSRLVEDLLRKNLQAQKTIQCRIPRNTQGHAQRSGYPDLWLTHTNEQGRSTHVYLDPKLYKQHSESSTLRSFYFKPSTETIKVQHDAIHLILGIQHHGPTGNWHFDHWSLHDLSGLKLRFKAEFQASNRELYKKAPLIKQSGT